MLSMLSETKQFDHDLSWLGDWFSNSACWHLRNGPENPYTDHEFFKRPSTILATLWLHLVFRADWFVIVIFSSRVFRYISPYVPVHYSTLLHSTQSPNTGMACSNKWPRHHWCSPEWKRKDLGIHATDVWALPGWSSCGGLMKLFGFSGLDVCVSWKSFPDQFLLSLDFTLLLCNQFHWRCFLEKISLSFTTVSYSILIHYKYIYILSLYTITYNACCMCCMNNL